MTRHFDRLVKALSLAGALLAAAIAAPAPAAAGSSCPYIVTNAQLSAAQWNFCFTAKQNELGYTPLNKAGDGMQGILTTVAPTTAIAGFRLYPGVPPAVPVDGDLWTTTAGLYVRINGTTVGPLRDSTAGSFAAVSPLGVTFPASVVTYALDFTVANSWLATQTMRTVLAGTTNTYDIGTSATVSAFRTIYAGTSFVGPIGTFTTSVAVGGATIGANALAVTGTSLFNSGVTIGAALTYGGVTLANSVTGTGPMVLSVSPTLTGTLSSAVHIITSVSVNALAVGPAGTTNPTLQVDASTASAATGLKVKGAAAAGGLALSVITSGTNENLTIDAAGLGTITIGGVSTGQITLNRSTTIGAALTYGGVTLANSVTGTGSMALSASPTFTGTLAAAAITATTFNGLTVSTSTGTLAVANGKTLTASNSISLVGTDATTWTGPSTNATLAALNIASQVITGGATVTTLAQSTGNLTVDCGARPAQSITNGAAFTLTAPSADGYCVLLVTNNATAGAITFASWSVGSNTGDALTTTNLSKFLIFVYRVGGSSTYSVKALQ